MSQEIHEWLKLNPGGYPLERTSRGSVCIVPHPLSNIYKKVLPLYPLLLGVCVTCVLTRSLLLDSGLFFYIFVYI